MAQLVTMTAEPIILGGSGSFPVDKVLKMSNRWTLCLKFVSSFFLGIQFLNGQQSLKVKTTLPFFAVLYEF
jgi:hypothetical protein